MKPLLLLFVIPGIIYPCQWLGSVAPNTSAAGALAFLWCLAFLVCVVLLGGLLHLLNCRRTTLRAYYKVRQLSDGTCLAWASLKPLSADSPLREDNGATIHSDFATTREEAVKAICEEMESYHGPLHWTHCV